MRLVFLLSALWLLTTAAAQNATTETSSAPCLRSPGKRLVCVYQEGDGLEPRDLDPCLCSHLVFEGLSFDNQLAIRGRNDNLLKSLNSLKERNPRLVTLLSLSKTSEALTSQGVTSNVALTDTLAKKLQRLTRDVKVDGINLDWQYRDVKLDANLTQEREALTGFLKNLRNGLPDLLLAITTSKNPKVLAKGYDFRNISKHVDFVSVPAFEFSESNDDDSGEPVVKHPGRLHGVADMENVDSTVDLLLTLGMNKEKLVVGVPSYGVSYLLVDVNQTTPGSPAKDARPKILSHSQICALRREGNWTQIREKDQTAPYAFKGETWIAYDDEISLRLKTKYAMLRNLGGLMIWGLNQDDFKGNCGNGRFPLLRSISDVISGSRSASQNGTDELEEYLDYSESRVVEVYDQIGNIFSTIGAGETVDGMTCTRQGYYRLPADCSQFYRCVKFDQRNDAYSVFRYDCPAGLVFDDRHEVCNWPSWSPPCLGSGEVLPTPKADFICPGVGYFADPENCRWFFYCNDIYGNGTLTAYEFKCPYELAFDENRLLCDFRWMVPSCAGRGGVGVVSGFVRDAYQESRHLVDSNGALGHDGAPRGFRIKPLNGYQGYAAYEPSPVVEYRSDYLVKDGVKSLESPGFISRQEDLVSNVKYPVVSGFGSEGYINVPFGITAGNQGLVGVKSTGQQVIGVLPQGLERINLSPHSAEPQAAAGVSFDEKLLDGSVYYSNPANLGVVPAQPQIHGTGFVSSNVQIEPATVGISRVKENVELSSFGGHGALPLGPVNNDGLLNGNVRIPAITPNLSSDKNLFGETALPQQIRRGNSGTFNSHFIKLTSHTKGIPDPPGVTGNQRINFGLANARLSGHLAQQLENAAAALTEPADYPDSGAKIVQPLVIERQFRNQDTSVPIRPVITGPGFHPQPSPQIGTVAIHSTGPAISTGPIVSNQFTKVPLYPENRGEIIYNAPLVSNVNKEIHPVFAPVQRYPDSFSNGNAFRDDHLVQTGNPPNYGNAPALKSIHSSAISIEQPGLVLNGPVLKSVHSPAIPVAQPVLVQKSQGFQNIPVSHPPVLKSVSTPAVPVVQPVLVQQGHIPNAHFIQPAPLVNYNPLPNNAVFKPGVSLQSNIHLPTNFDGPTVEIGNLREADGFRPLSVGPVLQPAGRLNLASPSIPSGPLDSFGRVIPAKGDGGVVPRPRVSINFNELPIAQKSIGALPPPSPFPPNIAPNTYFSSVHGTIHLPSGGRINLPVDKTPVSVPEAPVRILQQVAPGKNCNCQSNSITITNLVPLLSQEPPPPKIQPVLLPQRVNYALPKVPKEVVRHEVEIIRPLPPPPPPPPRRIIPVIPQIEVKSIQKPPVPLIQPVLEIRRPPPPPPAPKVQFIEPQVERYQLSPPPPPPPKIQFFEPQFEIYESPPPPPPAPNVKFIQPQIEIPPPPPPPVQKVQIVQPQVELYQPPPPPVKSIHKEPIFISNPPPPPPVKSIHKAVEFVQPLPPPPPPPPVRHFPKVSAPEVEFYQPPPPPPPPVKSIHKQQIKLIQPEVQVFSQPPPPLPITKIYTEPIFHPPPPPPPQKFIEPPPTPIKSIHQQRIEIIQPQLEIYQPPTPHIEIYRNHPPPPPPPPVKSIYKQVEILQPVKVPPPLPITEVRKPVEIHQPPPPPPPPPVKYVHKQRVHIIEQPIYEPPPPPPPPIKIVQKQKVQIIEQPVYQPLSPPPVKSMYKQPVQIIQPEIRLQPVLPPPRPIPVKKVFQPVVEVYQRPPPPTPVVKIAPVVQPHFEIYRIPPPPPPTPEVFYQPPPPVQVVKSIQKVPVIQPQIEVYKAPPQPPQPIKVKIAPVKEVIPPVEVYEPIPPPPPPPRPIKVVSKIIEKEVIPVRPLPVKPRIQESVNYAPLRTVKPVPILNKAVEIQRIPVQPISIAHPAPPAPLKVISEPVRRLPPVRPTSTSYIFRQPPSGPKSAYTQPPPEEPRILEPKNEFDRIPAPLPDDDGRLALPSSQPSIATGNARYGQRIKPSAQIIEPEAPLEVVNGGPRRLEVPPKSAQRGERFKSINSPPVRAKIIQNDAPLLRDSPKSISVSSVSEIREEFDDGPIDQGKDILGGNFRKLNANKRLFRNDRRGPDSSKSNDRERSFQEQDNPTQYVNPDEDFTKSINKDRVFEDGAKSSQIQDRSKSISLQNQGKSIQIGDRPFEDEPKSIHILDQESYVPLDVRDEQKSNVRNGVRRRVRVRNRVKSSDKQGLVEIAKSINNTPLLEVHAEGLPAIEESKSAKQKGRGRGVKSSLPHTACTRPGLFRHPDDCNKFYECFYDKWINKFTLHMFECPVRLAFDDEVFGCTEIAAQTPCKKK